MDDGSMGASRAVSRYGVLHVDGGPRMLLATDYPYFRDDARNWRDRLRKMKAAGLTVLKVYVPWRHHAPEDPVHGDGAYDFTGRTQPNRNLKGLLDLAHEEGLLAILKPGPFVHAELPYGGLPDYVNPDRNPAIEVELDAWGRRVEWALDRMHPQSRHPLPAPFGNAFNVYVRDWFRAVAREVAVPHFTPRGPVFAFQLLNEGIYSESSKAEPAQLGFAPTTLHRYRRFLARHYGSVDAYNALHARTIDDWSEIDPPRQVHRLHDTRDLLPYLDWSRFQSALYVDVARQYKRYLVEGGVPADVPVLFNFNPNGDTYRMRPASNDGWYTRVNVLAGASLVRANAGADGAGADGAPAEQEFQFGSTNWLGVVSNDPTAFRQYVMALTAFRGPNLEQNWGFLTLYDPPYGFVTPSTFETMLGVACGATGLTVYTLAGTRAWREDPNLRGEWVPERTNANADDTDGDYPGAAPILSDGSLTPKYRTLQQMMQYFRTEGPRFVDPGPACALAWGIYPPYAWAGQWLTRGDPDDLLWRPPLNAVPRGAFHGLDAFVEMATGAGVGFQQVDVALADVDLSRYRVICVSAFEYMDADTQERLARYVEDGGALLLTGMVPDKDVDLRPMRGALAERVLPHATVGLERFSGTWRVEKDGQVVGYAREVAFPVTPPEDATATLHIGAHVVGYMRRVGKGRAYYVGFSPWRARYSGDDRRVAATNQRLMWDLVELLAEGKAAAARPLTDTGEVVAWQHNGADADEQQVFVVVRDTDGEVSARFTRGDGTEDALTVTSPSQAVHVVALAGGRVRSCWLKGVNDIRAEAVAPVVTVRGETWGALDACDVCITRDADGALHVSVAHTANGDARVRLPVPLEDVERVTDDAGHEVSVEPLEDGVMIRVRDVRDAGAYTVRLVRARDTRAAEARGAV